MPVPRRTSPTRPARAVTIAAASVCAVALAVTSVSAQPAGAASSRAARTVSAYGATAYGSLASFGPMVQSGPTASQPMCTTAAPTGHANTTAALRLPHGLGQVGATVNHVASARSGSSRVATASSYTAASGLLPGNVIRAGAISSISRVQHIGWRFRNTGSSRLLGLTVAGRPVHITGAPNQAVSTGALGIRLTLNRQYASVRGGVHYYTVDALVLSISRGNLLGLPAGFLIVGHSQASLHTLTFRLPYGAAWTSSANLGDTVASGRTSPSYVLCGGTDGSTVANSAATLNVPGLLTSGVASTTAHSYDGARNSTANTQAHLGNLNVLGGRIQVTSLTVRATVTRTGKKITRSSAGTGLLGLRINGRPLSAPAPNTARSVPGLGTVYFGRTVTTGTGMTVYGMMIIISRPIGQYHAGSTILIGVAAAGVKTR